SVLGIKNTLQIMDKDKQTRLTACFVYQFLLRFCGIAIDKGITFNNEGPEDKKCYTLGFFLILVVLLCLITMFLFISLAYKVL
ncbi:hypothetical protein ACJX0J_035173, partial [Zea mays]